MNTRIRYSKIDETGSLTSRRVFTTGDGKQVQAVLDTVTKTYYIKDVLSGEALVSGGGTRNLSVLKIKAKDALLTLGCDFAEENRRERSVKPATEG
jgi:hypothetical protein